MIRMKSNFGFVFQFQYMPLLANIVDVVSLVGISLELCKNME